MFLPLGGSGTSCNHITDIQPPDKVGITVVAMEHHHHHHHQYSLEIVCVFFLPGNGRKRPGFTEIPLFLDFFFFFFFFYLLRKIIWLNQRINAVWCQAGSMQYK